MTAVEAARLVAMLLQAYPQAQFAPASSALYERELADLDSTAGLLAVQRLIRTSKWLPTVAEIRTTAADVTGGPKRLGAESWGDVVDAIRRIGSYRAAPDFVDPNTSECVRLLGWINLCRGSNEAADRARFIELYEGLAERERADTVAGKALPAPMPRGQLPWRVETRQLAAPPVRIGLSPEQAQALLEIDTESRGQS